MKKEKWKDCNNNRLWCGLIVMMVGVVFLLKNWGINIPEWILTWNVLLIMIGLLIGYKRNFEGGGWLIMILVGGFFTFKDLVDLDLSRYYIPGAFIILGLFMIIKPKRNISRMERYKRKYARFHDERFNRDWFNKDSPFTEDKEQVADKKEEKTDELDVLDSVSIFGGSEQNVFSKNFKGGDLIAIFGGCVVNLTQADFEGTIVLDVVAFFGGIKIIVPSSWEVKSEVTAVFGGLDDKRSAVIPSETSRKVLKINGVALFGGVEIRNF